MVVKSYYRQIREDIADKRFDKLTGRVVDKPDYFNWAKDIFEPLNVAQYPDANALIWKSGSEEKQFTFKEIAVYSNQLLNYLRHNGVEPGSIIYTQLPLVPANWFCYLTAIKGGYIVIPAATTLSKKDIIYRFGQRLPQVVIADQVNAGKIDEALNESGQSVKVKLITDVQTDGWQLLDDAVADQSTSAEAADTRADDPLFYFFTSGTTGMPKIVTHTHFSYPIGHLATASWIGLNHGDIHYNISQPGWAKFAWSSFFAPWAVGATIFAFHTEKFNAAQQLRTMEEQQISTFCAPPTALRMLIQEDLSEYQFKLRQCVAAGEPLSPDIIDAWKKGTGILIRDGYGQTESTCMVANLPGARVKHGSMGKPTFLYDIIIADDEGNEMPATETGNICLKVSDNMINGLFKGYEGDKGKEAEVFRHGLYYTGDKAYKDEDGYIWFVGRDDDVIKSSDYRIGPFEVESVLSDHPAVVEVAVVASPHNLRGNVVKAFILVNKNTEINEDLAAEFFTFTEKHLAVYKIPRIIEFVSEFPKTVSGKIRRVELRADEAVQRQKEVVKDNEFFHDKY